MIELVIQGQTISKKNSQRILYNKARGTRFIAQSQQYEDYEKIAILQLHQQYKGDAIVSPVNVKCLFYMRSRHKVDMSNLISSVSDVLVRAGVLEDDNFKIIAGYDGSRVLYDPKAPRCEITITDMEG